MRFNRGQREGTEQCFPGSLGRPEWREDVRFRTNTARVGNREPLEGQLEESFRAEPRQAWLSRFSAAGIPAGPVRGPLEALQSETAHALELVREAAGVSFVASPLRIEGHEPPLRFPPQLDADGDRLRKEFGLPGADVPRSRKT